MKLKELAAAIESVKENPDWEKLDVVIFKKDESVGPISATSIRSASRGFDWDFEKFILFPTKPIKELT